MPHVKNAENRDSTLIRKTKRRVDESPRLGVDVEVALSVEDDADVTADGEPAKDVGEDIEIGCRSPLALDSVMGVFLYLQIWVPWHCATTLVKERLTHPRYNCVKYGVCYSRHVIDDAVGVKSGNEIGLPAVLMNTHVVITVSNPRNRDDPHLGGARFRLSGSIGSDRDDGQKMLKLIPRRLVPWQYE